MLAVVMTMMVMMMMMMLLLSCMTRGIMRRLPRLELKVRASGKCIPSISELRAATQIGWGSVTQNGWAQGCRFWGVCDGDGAVSFVGWKG